MDRPRAQLHRSPGSPAAGVTTEEINFQGCLYNREAMFQRALDPPLHIDVSPGSWTFKRTVEEKI
jgi:hypothetical protein